MADNHCQGCDLCCRLLPVEAFKATNVDCQHIKPGTGCGIYNTRPQACRTYVCVWLDSQRQADTRAHMRREMRPNVSHVVLGPRNWLETKGLTLHVHVDPKYPEAWKQGYIRDYLMMLTTKGVKLSIHIGNKRIMIKGDIGFSGTDQEFETLESQDQ